MGGRLSIPDLLSQLAVLGAVFYLGLAWHQMPKGLPPPVGHPLVLPPDPVPLASARPVPTPAQTPLELSPPAETPTPEEPLEQPSPSPTLEPSPTPSPKAARSELDVKREQAESGFDQTLGRLQAEAKRLVLNATQFESLCLGGPGEPASCARVLNQISASADSLSRGMQEAEEEARRAWVTPGVVRDLRQRHGLDESTVSDLCGRAGRLEAQFQGKP